jgi:hypothetical protein
MSDELAFSSKVDLWLLIVLLVAVAICGAILAHNWNELLGRGWLFTALIGIPLAIGVIFPLWIVVSLRYFLSDQALRIRCGPFTWRIALGEITAVSETSNPLSSPALSFDRLRIEYGNGRAVMISPEPREEFLRQLNHRRQTARA